MPYAIYNTEKNQYVKSLLLGVQWTQKKKEATAFNKEKTVDALIHLHNLKNCESVEIPEPQQEHTSI